MGRGIDDGRRWEWEERLRRYAKSGLTVLEFCEWEGVSAAAFYNWRKKLAGDQPGRTRNRSMRAAQASSGLEVPLDRNSFLPVRVTRPFAATSDLPFAAAESLCATSESPCAAPTSSRIEIRLTNGVCIFVPDADSGLLNTVISAVGRLSALPGGEAHEHDVLTEDMAC